jgi:two-component system, NarL family, response regulator NreC
MKIRILLADDHAVLRQGLRLMISSQPDMEVVGDAVDGAKAVTEAERLKPDVVVMDLTMGVHSGVPAIADIVERCPEARILVLTMHGDSAYVRTAFAAGATGYLIKSSDEHALHSAIRQVAAGHRFVDQSLDASLASTRSARHPPDDAPHAISLLSTREREVFGLVVQGFTNQQIAEKLSLGIKSVETYRARFMDKLQLHTRAELVKYALDCGMLTASR